MYQVKVWPAVMCVQILSLYKWFAIKFAVHIWLAVKCVQISSPYFCLQFCLQARCPYMAFNYVCRPDVHTWFAVICVQI